MLAIAALAGGVAAGEGVEVYATLEPPEIPFQRTARYTLAAECPAGVEVVFPEFGGGLDGLDIRVQGVDRVPLGKDRVRISTTYILDPVAIKTHVLPALEVRWGQNDARVLPPLGFRVRDLTASEREMASVFEDIIGPGPHASRSVSQGWWWGGALALLALAALLYRWWRKPEEEGPGPAPLPWEVAFQRLDELERRKLPQAGRFGPYYVDLSAILRYYIEDRFELHAPEQTTQEFLDAAAKGAVFNDEQQAFLEKLLRHCDYVKFARYKPSAEEMEKSFGVVKQFVRQTAPRVVQSEGAAA